MPHIPAPESGPFNVADYTAAALEGRQQDHDSNVMAR